MGYKSGSLFSRRAFLSSVGMGGVGVVAAGGLCAASDANALAEGDEGQIASGDEPAIEVIDAEVLVIGAGLNAQNAIAQALAEGAQITVVDKGVFRHAGTTGMCWDAFSTGVDVDPAVSMSGAKIVNRKLWEKALAFDPYAQKNIQRINLGQTMVDRNDDGTLAWYAVEDMYQALFFRREMDCTKSKAAVTVYDRTMITDLVVSDGRCLGAVGIHLPSGTFRVFCAKAIVAATGGCTWIHGSLTVRALTNATPDNTADVDMAAWRRGARVGDAEYAQYDIMTCTVPGLACGFGSSVCADAQEAHAIYDKDGELVFDPSDPMVQDRIYFCQQAGRVIHAEGRGTENGGVIVNIGDSVIRYSNERNIDVLKKFGVDPRSESLEAIPEMYEHGGAPVVDEGMMTDIEGLFCARGSGVYGESGGGQVLWNEIFGTYTGHCATEYAKSATPATSIDWDDVLAEFDRLQEIRTRTCEDADGGIRPHVVRKHIQAATLKGLGMYRDATGMQEAIAEFERIRSEELPRMATVDKSPTFNKEWREAIEAYNMLDNAEISVRASLLREETRGMYLRGDFPQADDENWACMLTCRSVDGEMEFEKVFF